MTKSIPENAVGALTRGNKIEAIKHVREALGLGLVEAKDMVERFLLSNPEVNSQYITASKNLSSGCLKYFVGFFLILAAAGYFIWQWRCCSPE